MSPYFTGTAGLCQGRARPRPGGSRARTDFPCPLPRIVLKSGERTHTQARGGGGRTREPRPCNFMSIGIGFDNQRYVETQSAHIRERIGQLG